MTLTVEIVRKLNGQLSAYVLQQGKRGSNLLSGQSISNVETARLRIHPALIRMIGIPDLTIEWTGEKPDAPLKLSEKPVQTARERYGWRSM
jgi:hypothetical protein